MNAHRFRPTLDFAAAAQAGRLCLLDRRNVPQTATGAPAARNPARNGPKSVESQFEFTLDIRPDPTKSHLSIFMQMDAFHGQTTRRRAKCSTFGDSAWTATAGQRLITANQGELMSSKAAIFSVSTPHPHPFLHPSRASLHGLRLEEEAGLPVAFRASATPGRPLTLKR